MSKPLNQLERDVLCELLDDEEIERAIAGLNHTQLEVLRSAGPSLPTVPGLYALVAPDGVTVRVVEGGVGVTELRLIVTRDILSRLLRSMLEEVVAGTMSFEQYTKKSLAQHLELKVLYRLELLSSSVGG